MQSFSRPLYFESNFEKYRSMPTCMTQPWVAVVNYDIIPPVGEDMIAGRFGRFVLSHEWVHSGDPGTGPGLGLVST